MPEFAFAQVPDDAETVESQGHTGYTGRCADGRVWCVALTWATGSDSKLDNCLRYWGDQIAQVRTIRINGGIVWQIVIDRNIVGAEQFGSLANEVHEWCRAKVFNSLAGNLPKPAAVGPLFLPDAELLSDAECLLTLADLPSLNVDDKAEDTTFFDVLSSAGLDMGDYNIRYLVDDVVVEGQPLIVGGPLKTLKTSLLVALAISMAAKVKFLGRFAVNESTRVLIMSGESGLGTLQETARRICKSHGLNLSNLHDLLWCEALPHLDDAKSVAQLVRTLQRDKVKALIIDPAYLSFGGTDHSNVFEQGKRFEIIRRAADKAGVQLILAHHFTKGAGRDFKPPSLSDLSQSGFAEWARSWILLKRRSAYKRDGHHELWLDAGGSAGHSALFELDVNEGSPDDIGGRVWEVDILNAAQKYAEQSDQLTRERETIVSILSENPDGLTLTRLAALSKVHRRRLKPILDALESDCIVRIAQVAHPQSATKTVDGYYLHEGAA